jgi:hypothetical protein
LPPHRRSASPAPPPGSLDHSAALYRAAAAGTDGHKAGASDVTSPPSRLLLFLAARSSGVHVIIEPTFNMTQPRCSSVCLQGMRLHRPPTISPIFCYKLVVVKSFHMYICRVYHTIHRTTSMI